MPVTLSVRLRHVAGAGFTPAEARSGLRVYGEKEGARGGTLVPPRRIGYGLDFAERYRNLPYVAVLHADLIPPAT